MASSQPISLSHRVQRVKPSPTLAITALAAALRSEGKDIIGLGAGEPDFDAPEPIKQAAIQATVRFMAEIMEEIGWRTQLIDLSEAQVLTLIEVAVSGFQDAMLATDGTDGARTIF